MRRPARTPPRTPLCPERLEPRLAPAVLPGGFTETVVASGLSAPTSMAFAPDGRIFVTEQGGDLRVVGPGGLLPDPFVSLQVDDRGERGLLGVALDPDFAANGFVYVYYTVPGTAAAAPFNRVSRFTASGDRAAPGSEVVLLELDPLSAATNHNGGAMHFGPDGKLYIAAGENARPAEAQELDSLLGKLLRINPDGSIPADNPFYGQTAGKNRAIWALGLRNPFTFAFQPGTGRMFINDVGQASWEEINDGVAGGNYGWPETEGPHNDPRFLNPVFAYPRGDDHDEGRAITGGAFYNPDAPRFPAEFTGDYFFADFVNGWVRRLDPVTREDFDFATGLTGPVDLDVGADGALYYLQRGAGGSTGAVFRIDFTPLPPPAPGEPPPILAGAGEGAPPRVRAFAADGPGSRELSPFEGAFTGGVRVASGDVTGDGVPDVVAGAGPGGGPVVRVLDGVTGAEVRALFAFEAAFTGGVFVAAADFNGDGFDDLVVTPDEGGGPRVRVFSGRDLSVLADFLGIEDPAFRGGARAGAGDVNGDGAPDLVVAAGFGGGPRVAVFDGTAVLRELAPGAVQPPKLLPDFFVFENTLRNGVFVAAGDLDGDGAGDLIFGAGPGGAPRVFALSGREMVRSGGGNRVVLANFFAGDAGSRGGVRVAAKDADGDARADLVTGPGPGAPPVVNVYLARDLTPQGTPPAARELTAFDPGFGGGVFVG